VNFMQWLNSLDELLYEIMSWLVFFPITLWRAVTRPLSMMDYADLELREGEDEQFGDTLSPPLFLVLTLLVSHGVELALGGGTNPIVARRDGLAALVTDNSTLLMLRLIFFSVFPLMMAVRLLRLQRKTLTRNRLKAPFYAQCYAAGPFALLLGLGTAISHAHQSWSAPVGLSLAALSLAIYLGVEARWFAHHLKISVARGFLKALGGFFLGVGLAFSIALLFSGKS